MKHPSDSIEDRRQKPWAMVETELLRDPSITPQCKALYGLLITYGPQSIFPGHETLAECMGASRSTIIRWLDEMRATGLIDWERRTGTSNRYYILGYENYKGDVAPVEQGCSTHATGDVAPVLHDLDPLILNQEQERPPSADSSPVVDSDDTAETAASFKKPPPSQEPPEQRIARMREKFHITPRENVAVPLEMAAVVERNRAEAAHPDMADPTRDFDVWWKDATRAFCAVAHVDYETLKPSYVIDWPRQIKKWADGWGESAPTAQETVQCLKGITESEHAWKTFTSPRQPSFQETMDVMLSRLRGGQPFNAEGKRNGGASGGVTTTGGQVQGNGFRAMPQAVRR